MAETRKAVGTVRAIEKLNLYRYRPYGLAARPYQVSVEVKSPLGNSTGGNTDLLKAVYFRDIPDIRVGDKVTITIKIGD